MPLGFNVLIVSLIRSISVLNKHELFFPREKTLDFLSARVLSFSGARSVNGSHFRSLLASV